MAAPERELVLEEIDNIINLTLFISLRLKHNHFMSGYFCTLSLMDHFSICHEQDDTQHWDSKQETGMGTAEIKYGDSTVLIQHKETGLWLSYLVRF